MIKVNGNEVIVETKNGLGGTLLEFTAVVRAVKQVLDAELPNAPTAEIVRMVTEEVLKKDAKVVMINMEELREQL